MDKTLTAKFRIHVRNISILGKYKKKIVVVVVVLWVVPDFTGFVLKFNLLLIILQFTTFIHL